jgi:hypothetical protein
MTRPGLVLVALGLRACSYVPEQGRAAVALPEPMAADVVGHFHVSSAPGFGRRQKHAVLAPGAGEGFSSSVEHTRAWVAPMLEQLPPVAAHNARSTGTDLVGYLTEGFGFDTFVRDDGTVYNTHSTTALGLELLMSYYPILDRERLRRGRRMAGLDPPPRRIRQPVTRAEGAATERRRKQIEAVFYV